jgi:CelD/BcsL family acetyltransferase involved in cellulose biosynthesis
MSDIGLAAAGRLRFEAGPAVGKAAAPGEIDLVATAEGFEALRDEWNDLFARAARPHQLFQSHAFLSHWRRHYLEPSMTLSIVAVRREGRLAGVWPLVLRRRLGVATLRIMGAPVAQFSDVLLDERCDPGDFARAGRAAMRGLGADCIVATQVRDDAALSRLSDLPGRIVTGSRLAPFARLAERVGRDGPGTAYDARERSAYRRRLRRLGESGELTMRSVEPGPEAAAMAARAVAFKRQWLDRQGGLSPTIADPRFAGFFADCAADAGSGLRVSVIEREHRPLGIDLSFDCAGGSFGHVLATDPDCEREGVGSVLIHHVFAAARARGTTVFDMLPPADPYKLRHADGTTGVRDLAFAFTPAGRLYCEMLLKRLQPMAKAAAKRLPPPLTRRLAALARR